MNPTSYARSPLGTPTPTTSFSRIVDSLRSSLAIFSIANFACMASATGLFGVISALGLMSQAHAADSVTQPARPALTVTAAKPQLRALSLQLGANGSVAAWQEAVIGSQSNGLALSEVLVNVGDVVQKGQLLAQFASETLAAEAMQSKAALAEAQANAADAAANAERARSLQGTDALSAQQMAQFLTADKAAQARVAAAQASLNLQLLRVSQAQVTAPDSGVISARSATLGAVLGPGTELFRMVRQGRLEWRAEVTASELSRLKPGIAVTVTAASGAQVKGRVRMIAPTVDPQTRAAIVYVDLPPIGSSAVRAVASVGATAAAKGRPEQGSAPRTSEAQGQPAQGGSAVREATSVGASAAAKGRPEQGSAPPGGSAAHAVASVGAHILPGMFAQGQFELGTSSGLTLPQQAVVIRDGFSHVFRLGSDNRVSELKVKTGRRNGDQVEVVEGLSPDDLIVVSGAGFLNDGDLVKVVAPKPPTQAGAK